VELWKTDADRLCFPLVEDGRAETEADLKGLVEEKEEEEDGVFA
jgi:hypothetical protein